MGMFFGILLLIGGAIATVFGLSQSNGVDYQMAKAFGVNADYTDMVDMCLYCGMVALVLGIVIFCLALMMRVSTPQPEIKREIVEPLPKEQVSDDAEK